MGFALAALGFAFAADEFPYSLTLHYRVFFVLQSITLFYRLLLGTTKYYFVLQSIVLYYRVLLRTIEYYTEYYSVLQ